MPAGIIMSAISGSLDSTGPGWRIIRSRLAAITPRQRAWVTGPVPASRPMRSSRRSKGSCAPISTAAIARTRRSCRPIAASGWSRSRPRFMTTPGQMPMQRSDPTSRVQALNARYRHHAASDVLAHALRDADAGRLALVSSFGAESVVLLHMIAVLRRDTPVIFVDTGMLFAETLVYQHELAERLDLRDLRIVRANKADLHSEDPARVLHRSNPDACCDLRKTRPLARALEGFDGWITGRKRYQGPSRAQGASRSTRWPIGPPKISAPTWTKTVCLGIPWWRAAIRPSAARSAPPAWRTMKTQDRAAGEVTTRPNAAYISKTGGLSAKERQHEYHRHRRRVSPRRLDSADIRTGRRAHGSWHRLALERRSTGACRPPARHQAHSRGLFQFFGWARLHHRAAPAPDGLQGPSARTGSRDRRSIRDGAARRVRRDRNLRGSGSAPARGSVAFPCKLAGA